MKSLTRREAAQYLLSHDHYCILSHCRPDGDTVGSSAALCLGLRKLGKTAHVLYNREVSDRYEWLHRGLSKETVGEEDTIVSTDVAAPNMLPKEFEPLLGRIALRIDHHGSATSFTELEVVDPDSASCAELVWDILKKMGVAMDPVLADAVYVGTSTDTGCFRYANTNAHSFETAAACTVAGGRVFELNQMLFETNSLGRLRIQAWIVENARFLQGGKAAVVAIPRAVEDQLGVTSDDMDNISSFLRTIAGVRLAATLRQGKDGETKISFRAVPGCDAAEAARKFGGGGHRGAAGATVNQPMEQVCREVERLLQEAEL